MIKLIIIRNLIFINIILKLIITHHITGKVMNSPKISIKTKFFKW